MTPPLLILDERLHQGDQGDPIGQVSPDVIDHDAPGPETLVDPVSEGVSLDLEPIPQVARAQGLLATPLWDIHPWISAECVPPPPEILQLSVSHRRLKSFSWVCPTAARNPSAECVPPPPEILQLSGSHRRQKSFSWVCPTAARNPSAECVPPPPEILQLSVSHRRQKSFSTASL